MYDRHINITLNLNNKPIAFRKFDCVYCRNTIKCKTLENCAIRSYIVQRTDNTTSAKNENSLNITLNANSVEELISTYQIAKRALRLRAIPQPKAR